MSVAQAMAWDRLVSSYSGNASLRLAGDVRQDLVLITPSRRSYSELRAEELVVIDLEGEPVEEILMPSSEAHLHLSVYKHRPDVGAVIHAHSVFASVAAVAGLAIPPIVDEMVVALGGEVRVAQYGFPGTEELSQRAVEALGDRNAVLLKNHGMVGVGRTLPEALEVCRLVERVAQIFVYSAMLGEVHPLPQEVVEIEQGIFRMQRDVLAQTGGPDADSA